MTTNDVNFDSGAGPSSKVQSDPSGSNKRVAIPSMPSSSVNKGNNNNNLSPGPSRKKILLSRHQRDLNRASKGKRSIIKGVVSKDGKSAIIQDEWQEDINSDEELRLIINDETHVIKVREEVNDEITVIQEKEKSNTKKRRQQQQKSTIVNFKNMGSVNEEEDE